MMVSIPEVWHVQTPVLGILQRGLWGLGPRCLLLLLQPPSTPHTHSSTLSFMAGAVCTCSRFTHWVQWFSQHAGCTFEHFSLGLKPLGVSELFHTLWHPAALTDWAIGLGVGWHCLCKSCAGDLALPFEMVADEFPAPIRIHGCVYTEIPDYIQLVLQLWGWKW